MNDQSSQINQNMQNNNLTNNLPNPEKKKKNTLIPIIVGILLVTIGVYIYFGVLKKPNDTLNSEITISETIKGYKNLFDWNGVYKKDDMEVHIYQSSLNEIAILISKIVDGEIKTANFVASVENNNVSYDSDFFGYNYKSTIVKNETGISLKYTTNEEGSDFTNVDVDLQKVSAPTSDMIGLYYNDDAYVIISEVTDNEVYVILKTKKISESEMIYFDNINNLKQEDEFRKINILRDNDGLEIISSAIDEENIFNVINGKYIKK